MSTLDQELARLAKDGEVYKGLAACFGLVQEKYELGKGPVSMGEEDKAELRRRVIEVVRMSKRYFSAGKPTGPFGQKIWDLQYQISNYLRNFNNTKGFLDGNVEPVVEQPDSKHL